MIVEPARREDFLALMRETYGSAMTAEEYEWWFDRNPAGPRVVSEARAEDGTPLGALAMSCLELSSGLTGFAVHAVTSPAARGQGVFSTLELHNERLAVEAGVGWILGFPNPVSGPVLVGRVGWEDVVPLRVWVRPKRLRRTGRGRLRAAPACPPFEPRHEASFPPIHVLRDASYLTWRYTDSPRAYLRVEGERGWVVVTHATWRGFSSAVICDAIGSGLPALLRRATAAVEADVAVAIVNPGEERDYLAAGFLPARRTIRFIGKRLTEDAPPLPKARRAWRLTLGDMDFF